MKKAVFVFLICFTSFAVHAQNGQLSLGVNLGIPVSSTSKVSPFVMNLEANYLFESSGEFKIGPSASYSHFVGKNGGNVLSYLPLAIAARFSYSNRFSLGADVGYGIAIKPQSAESGFYYRPLLIYHLNRFMQLNTSFSVISKINASVTHANVGLVFLL